MSDEPTTAGTAAGPSPQPPATAPDDTAAQAGGPGSANRRRRGSRGGRGRPRTGASGPEASADDDRNPELPDRASENRPSVEALDRATVRRPQIGDSRPAPQVGDTRPGADPDGGDGAPAPAKKRRRRGGRGRGSQGGGDGGQGGGGNRNGSGSNGAGGGRAAGRPIESIPYDGPIDLDDDELERRRGRERKGRPVGRYLMCVHVQREPGNDQPIATQIAVVEGRALVEHYVSRPSDDVSQIHGNIYLGKVQNVLPGMEAAFVDIGTPKNAVLYRGDLHFDADEVEGNGGKAGKTKQSNLRIEQLLKPKQTIICQVTKNPIGAKGARLTQEVSLPGRFVVLIPNSSTYGISKRLADDERKRLRSILDRVKPAQHGVIVRTAAEGVTDQEVEHDVLRLVEQWDQIEALAKRTQGAALLYREPDMAVRVIREELNSDYRGVVIDDPALHESVRDYVASISPELADRVELFDRAAEDLPLFERFHIHEQLH